MDEGATLEMWCGATHRGFESLSLRHFFYPPFNLAEKIILAIIFVKLVDTKAFSIFLSVCKKHTQGVELTQLVQMTVRLRFLHYLPEYF